MINIININNKGVVYSIIDGVAIIRGLPQVHLGISFDFNKNIIKIW